MLEFGSMSVEGFGSIRKENFNWGIPGLNIIKAPNGFGKSKFINALMWALYGKTLSGSVEPWDSVKGKDYKGTKVSLFFKKGGLEYQVIRCKNYTGVVRGAKGKNRLILVEDGEEFNSDGKAEVKEELITLLGYSFDLFKNSIIFGQKIKRLVSETGPNKKKVLDEAFEMVYIPKANKLALESLRKHEKELYDMEHRDELLTTKITSLKSEIAREQESIDLFEENKEKEIKEEKKSLKKLRVELKGYKEQLEKLEPLLNNITENNDKLEPLLKELNDLGNAAVDYAVKSSSLRASLNEREKLVKVIADIKEALQNIPLACDNCGKPFTKAELKEEAERISKRDKEKSKELQTLLISMGELQKDVTRAKTNQSRAETLTNSIETIRNENKLLEKRLSSTGEIKANIKSTKSNLKKTRSHIKTIKGRTLKKNIEGLQRALKDVELEQKTVSKEMQLVTKKVNDYKWLVSDPLSNSGLKAFIFDQMLDSINDRLDYYSKFSNMSVGFVMDMDSAKKDLNIYISNPQGEFVPYEDLSGGQQQKVDIVTLFAVHDVVSDSKNCSLLIMDELFESLDHDNIEILTELIQDKAYHKCLYLITHRSEFAPTNSNIISLDFTDGVTSIAS